MLGKPAAICACAGREKANFATTPHLSPPGRPPGGISPQAQRPACSQQHRRLFSAEREAPSPPEPPARASPRGGGGGGWVEVSLEPPAPAPRGASVVPPPPRTHSLTHSPLPRRRAGSAGVPRRPAEPERARPPPPGPPRRAAPAPPPDRAPARLTLPLAPELRARPLQTAYLRFPAAAAIDLFNFHPPPPPPPPPSLQVGAACRAGAVCSLSCRRTVLFDIGCCSRLLSSLAPSHPA